MTFISTAAFAALAFAADPVHPGSIKDDAADAEPDFDIVHARVTAEDRALVFHMAVSGRAGETRPTPTGELAGAEVFSYVWPTTLDTSAVGFGPDEGLLALAVTAHPDFDDTPLFDENADGDLGNDGYEWHSHWVVLAPDDACGAAALKVKDIPEGATPILPATWPGLPLFIDSPGYSPVIADQSVEVRVPFAHAPDALGAGFDAVAAGLQVNESVHAPLLCVVDVRDVGSNDLSLPGRVEK